MSNFNWLAGPLFGVGKIRQEGIPACAENGTTHDKTRHREERSDVAISLIVIKSVCARGRSSCTASSAAIFAGARGRTPATQMGVAGGLRRGRMQIYLVPNSLLWDK